MAKGGEREGERKGGGGEVRITKAKRKEQRGKEEGGAVCPRRMNEIFISDTEETLTYLLTFIHLLVLLLLFSPPSFSVFLSLSLCHCICFPSFLSFL